VLGPIESANREIREAERRDGERRLARLTEPRRLTDELLARLEELNLEGLATVPASCEPVLSVLRDHLSESPRIGPRLLDRLQPGSGISELIDTIFSIQEIIALRTQASEALPDEDEAIPPGLRPQ
jgi:hypothetical protein